MDKTTRHVMTGYLDLYLTMGPEESGRWIERIDVLPHGDKCCVLEEFEWAKERYPHHHRTRQYHFCLKVRQLLYSLLDEYWKLRRCYDGGYYYRYLPDPWPEESPHRYAKRVGIGMYMLQYQYVLQYQKEPYVDLRFALAMRLASERDRICYLVAGVSDSQAVEMCKDWPAIVDLWLLKLSSHPLVMLDSLEAARQSFDNFVFEQMALTQDSPPALPVGREL